MVVLDGIVMGPTHCAYNDCTSDLINARGGVFCPFHETQYGAKCRVHDCQRPKINATQACEQHQPEWQKYIQSHSHETLSGVRRVLRRPGEFYLGNPIFKGICSFMIKRYLSFKGRITLVQTISIVLKLFVLLVVK